MPRQDTQMTEPLMASIHEHSSATPSKANSNSNSNNSNSKMSSIGMVELDASMMAKLKYSCLVLGLLIGFFIQVSTIGASFLTNLPWAKLASGHSIAMYALVWSAITATASCGVMMVFRSFLEVAFHLTFGRTLNYSPATHDHVLDELVWYFESYFSLGVLVSVTLAWIATSFVLGTPTTLIDLVVTVALPVFWCISFFVIFVTKGGNKSNNHKKNNNNKKGKKTASDTDKAVLQPVFSSPALLAV